MKVNSCTPPEAVNKVWIDIHRKVASFHPADGSLVRSFISDQMFMDFLDNLMQSGYRFQ
jgi:hypothetical protein